MLIGLWTKNIGTKSVFTSYFYIYYGSHLIYSEIDIEGILLYFPNNVKQKEEEDFDEKRGATLFILAF